MATIVHSANTLSLAIQAITGVLGFYGLTIPIASSDIILKEVLGLELVVQVIEFLFYIGFYFIYNVKTLTESRYYDWFISTPVMLFTISLYFYYVNFLEHSESATDYGLVDFAKENKEQIIGFVALNFLMLLFGFLGELGIMNRGLAFILGSFALMGSFGIIYSNYGKFSQRTQKVFWVMFSLWSLYGFSYLLSPISKNLAYTGLDILAKNFFGIFLVYTLGQKRV